MKETLPLVSIALCTYNGQDYLAAQLDSILAQDYANLEIVISDDCSTDNTVAIIREYASSNPAINFKVNGHNLGFNKNFLSTISSCKGAYIAIADQDDIWNSNKITMMVRNVGNNLLIYHDSAFIDENGVPNGKSISSLHHFVKGESTVQLLYNNCISGHACLIAKELFKYVHEIPEGIYYDWWFGYIAACENRLNFVKEKLVQHRRHNKSSTATDKKNNKEIRRQQLTYFANYLSTPPKTKKLLYDLLEGYDVLDVKSFSPRLLFTLLKNLHSLFYIRKRSIFSKLKIILAECKRNP